MAQTVPAPPRPTVDDAMCCIPLTDGTSLRRRYTVGGMLSSDACTITYAGFDFKAHQPICIVEFFPRALAMRALESGTVSPQNRGCGAAYFLGSEAFLGQYGALTQAIGSPSIISVFDAFFENGTAYAVTERADGLTLEQYLAMRGAPLLEGELVYIGNALADALLIVHSLNLVHHAVAADRILLCTDGTVKLIGFCAAHEAIRLGRDVSAADPSCDIRALGKALFSALTGEAHGQSMDDAPALSAGLQPLFEGMLSPVAARRFATVFELRYAFSSVDIPPLCPPLTSTDVGTFQQAHTAGASALEQAAQPASFIPQKKKPRSAHAVKHLLVGVIALVAVLAAALLLLLCNR